MNEIYIDNINLDSNDWLAAFNGDICVGARKWDINMCTNNVCDIGVMGNDGSDATDGYMLNGQFPTFKLFDASENIYYDAIPSDNFPFVNGGLFVIDNINQSDYYCDSNPSCSGCIDINACNYDSSALIEDTCYYFESDLLQPFNNEVILLGDLPGGTINFEWSNINQSCYEEELNYNIQIFDSNNQIIFSQLTQENNIPISYSDLNINEGVINLYSWNILIDDIPLSDVFSFSIDATMMNVIDNKVDNFKIYQNYPNPFNPFTCIEFEIFSSDFIQVNVYDVEGNLIDNLASDYYNQGNEGKSEPIHRVDLPTTTDIPGASGPALSVVDTTTKTNTTLYGPYSPNGSYSSYNTEYFAHREQLKIAWEWYAQNYPEQIPYVDPNGTNNVKYFSGMGFNSLWGSVTNNNIWHTREIDFLNDDAWHAETYGLGDPDYWMDYDGDGDGFSNCMGDQWSCSLNPSP